MTSLHRYSARQQSRNFTYIKNVISANILSAMTPGLKHEIFNVGNGQDNTILELVSVLNRIVGKNIQPKFLPVRAGDVLKTHADISKISHRIDYKPLVNFEDGLKITVEYFKNKFNT